MSRRMHSSVPGRRGLFYLRDEEWTPIPPWARFFVEVGESVGAQIAEDVRTVAGVVLPIRSYAAALAAAGVVAARSSTPVSPADPYEYFEWLASLPKGTAVCLRDGDRELRAVLLGCEETAYGPRVGVQVEKKVKGCGGLRRWFPPDSCKRIRRLEKELCAADLPKAQSGRSVVAEKEIVERNRFAQAFLGDANICDFVACSRLECLIAGPVGVLRQEIKETTFATQATGTASPVEGTLQEILRVRKFSGVNDGYRTNAVYGNGGSAAEHSPAPTVVVFDGAASFAKLRDDFRDSSWIVLIDQAERLADEAIDLLNGGYLQNRIEGSCGPDTPNVPAGVEMSIFQEAV